MKISEVEILIEAYREEGRKKRNAMLRARLSSPCSREELLARLSGASQLHGKRSEGQILLTKSSAPFIMEAVR